MCPDSKCCEFCGGPNHLTAHIKTGYGKIIPVIMCCDCFMLLTKAEGERTPHKMEDPYEGLETYSIELGACGTCGYCMIEGVDYPVFVRDDGREFRIPVGFAPPAMLCAANGGIRSCSRSETCPDYEDEEGGSKRWRTIREVAP